MVATLLIINLIGLFSTYILFKRTRTGQLTWLVCSSIAFIFYLLYYFIGIKPKTDFSFASGDFWHFYQDLFFFGIGIVVIMSMIGILFRIIPKKNQANNFKNQRFFEITTIILYPLLVVYIGYSKDAFGLNVHSNMSYSNYSNEVNIDQSSSKDDSEENKVIPFEKQNRLVYFNEVHGFQFEYPELSEINDEFELLTVMPLIFKFGESSSFTLLMYRADSGLRSFGEGEKRREKLNKNHGKILNEGFLSIDGIDFQFVHAVRNIMDDLNYHTVAYVGILDNGEYMFLQYYSSNEKDLKHFKSIIKSIKFSR